ncbi:MAG: hypothetical protein ACI87E_001689 [Mariniblastus sp.]
MRLTVQSVLSIDVPAPVQKLVTQSLLDQYTTGRSDRKVRAQIQDLDYDECFPSGVVDENMAACSLSGIWLLHGFLDDSHEISQSVKTREGSYWHGIMHRLEGDFRNSKYWYRQVGTHPIYEQMPGSPWAPSEFVDLCEAAQSASDESAITVQSLAATEWKLLFEYCYSHAVK